MPRRTIDLILPKRNIVARARMLETEAPRTCEFIWERLPIESQIIHAWYSGCEVYFHFPWRGVTPPKENTTICTDAGDLFFYYAPWYRADAKPSGEIAIYYDRDAIPMGTAGPMAGSLFAEIFSGRAKFARACESIWTEGSETLLIRRGANR